jgi:hypothetical protein
MAFENVRRKWHILFKILPLLVLIIALKIAFYLSNFEVISLSALFTSLIAATTFLIGFLITGVISDYKESEKLPGEMAATLEAIYDEAYIINKNKQTTLTNEFMEFQRGLIQSVEDWFFKKERTKNLMVKVSKLNDYFAGLEPLAQATFINRLKQEQTNLRRQITRVHTIRETNFVESAYAIVEALAFFVIIGLIAMKPDPLTVNESIAFTLVVSFLVLYMLFLIKDLDDPFEYEKYGESGSEISLKPIHDLLKRVNLKE